MNKLQIILASQSIGRKRLLKQVGIVFKSHSSGYDEDMSAYKSPKKLATFLALGKAAFITSKFPNCIIIGADTFITLGRAKIGKPKSIPNAHKIISSMSGKTIQVHSGVAVLRTNAQGEIIKTVTEHVVTKLKIKTMSPQEIQLLATQKNVLKISGAFSIEGPGGKMIQKIDGKPFNSQQPKPTNAYSNVIGLPTSTLQKMLKKVKGID